MPTRDRRTFDPRRARQILAMVKLSNIAFMDLLNRMTGGAAKPQDVSAWVRGRRPLPDAAIVLLKVIVREAQRRRGRKRPLNARLH